MAALTLRSVKGSPLTNNEVDANFTSLDSDVALRLLASSNLSDVANASTARTNLGVPSVQESQDYAVAMAIALG